MGHARRAEFTVLAVCAGVALGCSGGDPNDGIEETTTTVPTTSAVGEPVQVVVRPFVLSDAEPDGTSTLPFSAVSIGEHLLVPSLQWECGADFGTPIVFTSLDGADLVQSDDEVLSLVVDAPFASEGHRTVTVAEIFDDAGAAANHLIESVDGSEWTSTPITTDSLRDPEGNIVLHVEALEYVDDRYVLLGTATDLSADTGGEPVSESLGTPVAWTSADGLTWEESSGDALGTPADRYPFRTVLLQHDSRLDVFKTFDAGPNPSEALTTTIEHWTSSDGGATWGDVVVDPLPDPGSGLAIDLIDVVQIDGGYLAVASIAAVDGPAAEAAAWTSTDLETWEPVTQGSFGQVSWPSQVARTAEGTFVVAGPGDDGTLTVLTSPDGRVWTAHHPPDAPELEGEPYLVHHAGGLVIVGSSPIDASECAGPMGPHQRVATWELTIE